MTAAKINAASALVRERDAQRAADKAAACREVAAMYPDDFDAAMARRGWRRVPWSERVPHRGGGRPQEWERVT